ncbi:MAG TPA: NUDIX hydrolase N-terminal domain-containing protein [Acidobacteriota bacterium]|nr:NUDIX hydrolase N-terminal domain-containing protein [Acidobacteriota bacterium]
MKSAKPPRFLEWAREIQALAQTEYHFAQDDYSRERSRRLMDVAAEIIGECSGVESGPLLDAFHAQIGYATPKVDVRAAVFQDGKLLLVRERIDGSWTMPGGWADVGDVPSQAAEREALEESGFRTKARKVIGVYDANRTGPLEVFHAYKIVFLCDLIGGEARTSDETSEVAFFARAEIPAIFSSERTQPRHVQDAFAALTNPDCPTVFD